MKNIVLKLKKCGNCKKEFMPAPGSIMQRACSPGCERKIREDRKAKNESRKSENKKRSIDALKALAIMNMHAYVRERDKDQPCVCCGRPLDDSYHAGHCFSAGGNSAVMFDEMNVHAQRSDCNTVGAGRFTEYKTKLIEKYGQKEFDELEGRSKNIRRYSVDEYSEIARKYKQKLQKIKNK